MDAALPRDVVKQLEILETGSESQRIGAIGELVYWSSFQRSTDVRIVNALIRALSRDESSVRMKAIKALKDLHCELPQAEVERFTAAYLAIPKAQRPKECPICGHELTQTRMRMACDYCGSVNLAIETRRLARATEYPRVKEPPEIRCFVPHSRTLVMAQDSEESEILFVVGQGDALPVVGERGEWHKVAVPGDEAGYVLKRDGVVLAFGTGQVPKPLGYARREGGGEAAQITAVQPDGTSVVIGTLGATDRLPVVAEGPTDYEVQLPSGARGLVRKDLVIRTLSPGSLPQVESPNPLSILALAAGAGVALALGAVSVALSDDSEQSKLDRAVDRALGDRGL